MYRGPVNVKGLTLFLHNLKEFAVKVHLLPWNISPKLIQIEKIFKIWFMKCIYLLQDFKIEIVNSNCKATSSHWFSEAAKENQIESFHKRFLSVASRTAWGDILDSPKTGSFLGRTLRNLLGFAVSEETWSVIIFSSSTFALRFFSLILAFSTLASLSVTFMDSSLASDACTLDLKGLLLLAASAK